MKNTGKKFLSDIKLHSDYLKWKDGLGRYETWEEACLDILDGHRKRYKGIDIEEELASAYESMKEMKLLASQRNLQFRYESIKKHNMKLFNCCTIHICRPRVFQEIFYMLLCGSGLGASLLRPFVYNLPKISERTGETKTFVIPDSIEGWADAIGVLMSSYFVDSQPFPEYSNCKIRFDYSQIRPRGSYISGGFKAPGPNGLKVALEKIEDIIEKWLVLRGNTIEPILAYDIICHISDSVLSGGLRRCLLANDDVFTKNGLIKIKDIEVGDDVLTHTGQYKKVTNKVNNGVRKTLKIVTNCGHYYSTPEHKWAIAKNINGEIEWKLAQDLVKGDTFVMNNQVISGQETSLPHSEDFEVPDLDTDMAWFIGYFLGNGSCSSHIRSDTGNEDNKFRVCVPKNYPDLENRLVKEFTKFTNKFSTNIRPNAIEITSSKRHLAKYFLKHFKQPDASIEIPSCIKLGTPQIRLAFLSGLLDSDGSVRNEIDSGRVGTGHVSIVSTRYYDFARSIQSLISSLGIPSKLDVKTRKSKSTEYVVKTIDSTFRNNLLKQMIVYSTKLQTDYNFEEISKERHGLSYNINLTTTPYQRRFVWQSNDYASYDKVYNKNKIGSGFIPVNILSVEESTMEEVYDIEVDEDHSFFINGILTHNSALSMIVDINDEEMTMAKTGNWRQENPQRARSNNSVLLIRNEVEKEQFEKLVALNNGDNDIGFVFADNNFQIFNPCLSASSKILTEKGEVSISSLDDGNTHIFINALGQKVKGKVSLTGYKPTVTLNLSNGNKMTCTEDHVFIDVEGNEVKAMDSKGLQLGHYAFNNLDFDEEFVKYGFLQGDGCLGRLKSDEHKGVEVNLGEDDEDVRKFFGVTSTDRCVYLSDGTKEKLLELGFSSEILPFRKLPSTINTWTNKQKLSFLRGLWSANGCIIKNGRVSFKSTCKDLIESLIVLLSEFGISSYYTTNKAKKVKFENGEYECRESYDLNIGAYSEIVKFAKMIGFIHSYKNNELATILTQKAPMVRKIVKNKGVEPVYDFSLDDLTHIGVVNGILTHNCFEIGMTPINTYEGLDNIPYDKIQEFCKNNLDLFGSQQCNLCEINAEKIKTKEEFLKVCKDATILGTLQAGYTNFPYMTKATEDISNREALLGVSITGWMNNPKMFSKEWLNEGAEVCKAVNKEFSKKIGINQAARITTTKPSGNASVILGTSSGIHPEHSERYFRIMQLNKESEVAKFLSANMPYLLEDSVWSANKTDYVVFIPIINPSNALFKDSMKGVKHLELIKIAQEEWVNKGKNEELCISKSTNHNVSNTVIIDNFEEIINYIWEHKDVFTAVSFISDFGDKDFNQAPFTSVLTPDEIFEKYGKGALFASGLIVDGLHYFEGNLWQACDSALDKTIPVVGTREQVLLKKSWLDRAKKFAKNYFKGDMKNMVYCLKDVHLSHKWETIARQLKEVDFSKILPKPEYTEVEKFAGVACSGGACTVTQL